MVSFSYKDKHIGRFSDLHYCTFNSDTLLVSLVRKKFCKHSFLGLDIAPSDKTLKINDPAMLVLFSTFYFTSVPFDFKGGDLQI